MHGPLPILAALHGASPDVSTSSLIVRSVGFAAQDRRATNKRIRNKVAVGIGITLSLAMAFEMNWMLYGLIYIRMDRLEVLCYVCWNIYWSDDVRLDTAMSDKCNLRQPTSLDAHQIGRKWKVNKINCSEIFNFSHDLCDVHVTSVSYNYMSRVPWHTPSISMEHKG